MRLTTLIRPASTSFTVLKPLVQGELFGFPTVICQYVDLKLGPFAQLVILPPDSLQGSSRQHLYPVSIPLKDVVAVFETQGTEPIGFGTEAD